MKKKVESPVLQQLIYASQTGVQLGGWEQVLWSFNMDSPMSLPKNTTYVVVMLSATLGSQCMLL